MCDPRVPSRSHPVRLGFSLLCRQKRNAIDMNPVLHPVSRNRILYVVLVIVFPTLSSLIARGSSPLPEMSLHGEAKQSDLTLTCDSGAVGSVSDALNPREWAYGVGKYDFALGEESLDSLAQYKIPVFVYQHDQRDTPVGEFVVRCDSSGSYVDKIQEFAFTFSQKGEKDRSLKFEHFPFHSRERDFQLIEVQEIDKVTQSSKDRLLSRKEFFAADGPADIGSGGDKLPLTLSSKSTSFPITAEVNMIRRTNDCWADVDETFPKNLGTFKFDTTKELTIPVKFRTWCALGHSLFHVLPQQTDAETELVILYAPQNGVPRQMPFVYRIHFQPTWLQLLLAAGLGLSIGIAIRFLSRDEKNNLRRTLVEFGAALAAVVVAELVCLIGFILEKPSTFWSIDLDPHRWLPCFAIALFASGGAAVRTWMNKAKDSISDSRRGDSEDGASAPAAPNRGGGS